MKKYFVLFYLVSFFTGLTAQKSTDSMVKIGEIKVEAIRELKQLHTGQMPVLFDKRNNLYVYRRTYPETKVDVYSSRLMMIKEIKSTILLEEAAQTWVDLESAYIYGGKNIVQNFTTQSFWDLGELPPAYGGSSIGVFKNLVLDVDGSGKFRGYLLTSGSTVPKPMTHEETMRYIYLNQKELELSIEGDLVLYRGIPWYEYAQHKKKWAEAYGTPFSIDKDGNLYWPGLVLNSKGMIAQDVDLLDKEGNPVYSQVAFDFEGNIYPIKWTQIFYIGRDWGYPDAKKGTVTLDSATLKLHPGAAELTIATAKPGPVTVFEKTLQIEAVDGKTAAWYKVKLATGLVGWIHGSALTVSEDATLKTFDSPVLGKK